MTSVRYLTPMQLKEVATANAVTSPILAHKVVGGRVELHLLGHSRPIAYDLPPEVATQLAAEDFNEGRVIAKADLKAALELEPPAEDVGAAIAELDDLDYKALYKLAQVYNIRGRSSMLNEDLRQAIAEVYRGHFPEPR